MNPQDDVITAIATPIGEGGISVIRVSGKESLRVVDSCFRGKGTLQTAATHTAHVGHIINEMNEPIDEVVVTVFREPHSYTAEDCVEVSCHGGIFVTKKVLEVILCCGARMAEPGEFTKRAFLNGRIDLSRAEAVADIIKSQSESSLWASVRQLEGMLSNKVSSLREELIKICSLIELELDFSEEGIELGDKSILTSEIQTLASEMSRMVDSYSRGRIYREGAVVALVGRPNVGKSSIFNSLINTKRAIVTAIPGTTRDKIEESLQIGGMMFKLVDTAGLRATHDLVEKEGIKLTEEQLDQANLVVYIVDARAGFTNDDEDFLTKRIERDPKLVERCLVVVNKMDLVEETDVVKVPSKLQSLRILQVSAKTGSGIEVLRNLLKEISLPAPLAEGSYLVTNARHRECLIKSKDALLRAADCVRSRRSNEVVAFELRDAISYLEMIIGVVTTDDILDSIFSKFCIGK